MKKQTKIILGFALLIAVLFLSFYLATRNTNTSTNNQEVANQTELGQEGQEGEEVSLKQVMTEEEKEAFKINPNAEYEVISRDEDGEVATYKIVTPLERLDADIEFMTKEEIREKSLYEEGRYQVLERDDEGKISAYKIIYSDDDIVREYGEYIFSY